MLADALMILGVVLVIELVSSVKELVFQRRLIEILDRFLSRSLSDYAASHSALSKQVVEQVNDWDVQMDMDSLNEAYSALRQPDRAEEPAETP